MGTCGSNEHTEDVVDFFTVIVSESWEFCGQNEPALAHKFSSFVVLYCLLFLCLLIFLHSIYLF